MWWRPARCWWPGTRAGRTARRCTARWAGRDDEAFDEDAALVAMGGTSVATPPPPPLLLFSLPLTLLYWLSGGDRAPRGRRGRRSASTLRRGMVSARAPDARARPQRLGRARQGHARRLRVVGRRRLDGVLGGRGGAARRVAPDGAEGFGRPNLHRALYVAPAAHEPGAARLYVVDETFGLAATGHAPRARAPCRTRAAAPVPTRRRADARAAGEGRWVHEYRFLADMSVDEPEVARPAAPRAHALRAPRSPRALGALALLCGRASLGGRAGVTRHARGRRSR